MPDTMSVDRTIARARGLARRGAFAEADRLYRAVLERYPNNRRAAEGLKALRKPGKSPSARRSRDYARRARRVVELERAGRREEARTAAFALVREYPDDAQLLYVAGTISLELGHVEDAVEALTAVVALQPTFTRALNNLGSALHRAGRRDEALQAYRRAVEVDPDFVAARTNLGVTLAEAGRHGEGAGVLRRAVDLDPADTTARRALGTVLREMARPEEAIEAFRTILSDHPDDAETHNNLANTLRGLGRHGEALDHYRRAIVARPDFAEAHNNMGVALAELGRAREAREAYHTALSLKPDYAEVHRNIGSVTRYVPGDERIETMRALLASPRTREAERMHLHFALFKALDDTGDTEAAFAHLAEGNAIRRACHPFDRGRAEEAARATEAFFSNGPPRCLGDDVVSATDRVPIFIVGMPRSGTTLTEQILCGHSAVDAIGEAPVLERALSEANAAIRGHTAATLPDEALLTIRQAYQAALAPYRPQRPVVVDKMLANHRWVGFIAAAFPEARIVDVRRDPVATCWSIYRHFFASRGNDYAYDQVDVAFYYRLYVERMAFWDEAFPGRVHRLDHAALTADPEGETRRLLAHCGLPFEEGCLSLRTDDRAVATASAQQVRKGLYRGDPQAWRRYERHLGPMLEALAPVMDTAPKGHRSAQDTARGAAAAS